MLTQDQHSSKLTAQKVLEEVFPSLSGSAQARAVHVIPQGTEPRWMIIGDARRALPVLRSWAPWNLGSRLRWGAVKLSASLSLLPSLPKIQNSTAKLDCSYWQSRYAQAPADCAGVIHVGSLSHTRKAILFLIGQSGNIVLSAKVPLVQGASDAILNEARILEKLNRFPWLPKVLFTDEQKGIAAQSWLEGKPVSRGFSEAHLKLLFAFEGQGAPARVSDFRNEVSADLDSIDMPYDRAVLASALELVEDTTPLRSFVEHRDFAPWNLKWLPEGGLGLLDWEWAVEHSLPWQDVCRFFYLDDFHFHGSGRVWEQMTSDPLLIEYCRHFEIPAEQLPALTMRYLLRVLPMDWIGGNKALSRYTFTQIERLLALRPKAVATGFESQIRTATGS